METEKARTKTRAVAGQERLFVDQAFKRFFIPSLLSNLGLALGGMADCLVVGSKLGPNGLSAISLGIPVYMFYNVLSYGFSIGGSIHYAALMGSGKPEAANRLFSNVLRFLVFAYLGTVALGLVFLPALLRLLGADPAYPEVYSIATRYVRAQLLCVPILFCQGPFYYFVHSDGAPKRAATALIISNAVDIALNYVFVIRMDMGAEGSVWSTAVGAVFCLAICGGRILRKRGQLRLCPAPFDLGELWRCFRTGFASAVQYAYQFITVLCANTLLLSIAGPMGVAVFDVIYNLSILSTAVADSVGMTLQPMVSTYRAERDSPAVLRTIKLSVLYGSGLSLLVAAGFGLGAARISVFFGLNGQAGGLGATALAIYATSILPAFLNQLAVYYRQTALREKSALLIQTLRLFALFLVFALALSRMGPFRFWWVFPLSETITLLYAAAGMRKRGRAKAREQGAAARSFTAYIESAALLGPTVEELQNTCEAWDCTPQQSYYATLVVEELCAAILEDSERNDRRDVLIKLTVVAGADGFTLHLRDNSYEFNPFASKGGPNDEGVNALGMSIVKKKAKEFFYRRYQGFNTLVVIL